MAIDLDSTQMCYGDVSRRQGYGLTEKDDSTGLNHTWFRKNENRAGRWTSPDPYNGSASLGNPQSFNRFSYVENEPTNFIDPTGLQREVQQACSYSGRRGPDGELIYDGYIKNGRCVSSAGTPVQVYFHSWALHSYNPIDAQEIRDVQLDNGGGFEEALPKQFCQPNGANRVGVEDNSLALAGSSNSAAALALTNKNQKIQFFRDPQTGRFYGNPYRANRVFKGIGVGTFGIGTVISGVQLYNGDVSVTEGSADIIVGAIATFGGPKGWLIGGVYFMYKLVPPPRYSRGIRFISTNTCHK